MDVTLPLEQMSVEEKLRVMEALWQDLCRHEDEIPVPDWHVMLLQETEQRVRSGEEKPMDWDAAKRLLRQRFE